MGSLVLCCGDGAVMNSTNLYVHMCLHSLFFFLCMFSQSMLVFVFNERPGAYWGMVSPFGLMFLSRWQWTICWRAREHKLLQIQTLFHRLPLLPIASCVMLSVDIITDWKSNIILVISVLFLCERCFHILWLVISMFISNLALLSMYTCRWWASSVSSMMNWKNAMEFLILLFQYKVKIDPRTAFLPFDFWVKINDRSIFTIRWTFTDMP
jgi:hypothetical protein